MKTYRVELDASDTFSAPHPPPPSPTLVPLHASCNIFENSPFPVSRGEDTRVILIHSWITVTYWRGSSSATKFASREVNT